MNRTGAVGALLDIYGQAIAALKEIIADIPDEELAVITDAETRDENCRSIQTILSHVVHAGYGYATSIHNLKGSNTVRPEKIFHITTTEYLQDLDNVFTYTEKIFEHIEDNELEAFDNSRKIKSGWGQWYDLEQMMEHAIVHILRHKRQIANIKLSILKLG